jgi:hypothetical protein
MYWWAYVDLDPDLTAREIASRSRPLARFAVTVSVEQQLVRKGIRPPDVVDELTMSVCASLKTHGERFQSDDECAPSWTPTGSNYTPDDLAVSP